MELSILSYQIVMIETLSVSSYVDDNDTCRKCSSVLK